MQRWVWLLAAGFIAIISVLALRGVVFRSVSRVRIAEYLGLDEDATEWDDGVSRGLLGRWLALAGYRSPRAGGVFLSLTGATTLLGLLLMFFISRSALIDFAIGALGNIPGAVGEIFVPVVRFGPWILVMILGFAPCAVVRARRRRIVREVEQDLPLVLELLATLGESGMGFDAAIARIVDSQPANRPLMIELRNFQRETLTGRPRVESLRRLAKRLDVQSLTIFISAIVHAEQVGSGISDVLRRQADDVRDRRRDRAEPRAIAPHQSLVPPGHLLPAGDLRLHARAGLRAVLPVRRVDTQPEVITVTDCWRLVERSSGRSIVDRLEVADRYWRRLLGLQFRPRPPTGFGLLLIPCSSIHTCFMRFPIDIIVLDRNGRAIEVRHAVRPWRVVLLPRQTSALVELPSGGERGKVEIGAMLRLEVPENGGRRVSRTLAAWCNELATS